MNLAYAGKRENDDCDYVNIIKIIALTNREYHIALLMSPADFAGIPILPEFLVQTRAVCLFSPCYRQQQPYSS